jgi:AmmeMemoRadiSam system protein A
MIKTLENGLTLTFLNCITLVGDHMTEHLLTQEDKLVLLKEARQSLELAVNRKKLPELHLADYSELLRTNGAAFVTLTENGELRGCIGTLEAYQPLIMDVRAHAIDAALKDYRFPPVQPGELSKIRIEISRLTSPQPFDYQNSEELIARLRKGIDGVILRDGFHRATFLPQVWEQLPDPADFLSHLCAKMGSSPNAWKIKHLDVSIYQVEEFHESEK